MKMLFWDGLDEAILGMAERINLSVVAYDVDKIIEILWLIWKLLKMS
jgi:hypothetical protein